MTHGTNRFNQFAKKPSRREVLRLGGGLTAAAAVGIPVPSAAAGADAAAGPVTLTVDTSIGVTIGQTQSGFNLIGFDQLTSYGGTSYYVQQMFARNIGDRILPVTAGGTQLSYSSTVETATGNVYTKIVNTASSAQPLNLNFRGSTPPKPASTYSATQTPMPPTPLTIQPGSSRTTSWCTARAANSVTRYPRTPYPR